MATKLHKFGFVIAIAVALLFGFLLFRDANRARYQVETSEYVLEGMPLNVFVADENGHIVRCSDRAVIAFGYDTASEIIGKPLSVLMADGSAHEKAFREAVRRWRKTANLTSEYDEHFMKTGLAQLKNGETRKVVTLVGPVFRNGRLLVVGTVRFEHELEAAIGKLRGAN